LGSPEEQERIQQELKQKEGEASELLELLQKFIDENVRQVRLSNRLVSSPACLVGAEMDYSPQMERLLLKGKGGGPKQRRVLEVNPNHEIFIKLLERFRRNSEDRILKASAELLLGYALLAEGSEIPDPVGFNRSVTDLMLRTL
jgi:molecular chaperone HtpG